MKTYRSIPKNVEDYYGQTFFGFDKVDGSNIRAEWSRKLSKKTSFTKGFGKYGTRNQMIKKVNDPFCFAIDIFEQDFAERLDEIFRKDKLFRGVDKITVYSEFWRWSSFAGQHDWILGNFELTMFDIFMYKKDFVKPADFMSIFGDLNIQKLVTKGILDEQIVKDIISNKYNLKEGLVLKGVSEGKVWMVKVKTQEWLDKVRAKYGIDNNIE